MMIAFMEELSLRAWPAYEEKIYDGWVLRFAEGYTKRANSVNPLYTSSVDVGEKIAYCEKAYGERGLPAVFKLTGESTPAELDRELTARGYDRLDETSVRLLSLGKGHAAVPGVGQFPRVCEEWLRSFARCSGIDDATTVEKLARILRSIPGETIFAYVKEKGRIVACGLGVLDQGYLGGFDIVVDPAYRKMGYGRRIMEGLLGTGAGRGAKTAYLQVVAGNRPAEKLYDSLGFSEIYRYWYRKE